MAYYDIGGYVLAGGRSSRMGRDKSLIELAGKPLVLRAVLKLRRLCADVAIAGGGPELDAFAPVVKDIHPGCGPLGGIEAALAHSTHDWNLFLPVDMPLMPSAVLEQFFVREALRNRASLVAIAHSVDGRDQPLCAMYHKALLPFVREALEEGECKVTPAIRQAASQIAMQRKHEWPPLFRQCVYASETVIIGDTHFPDGTVVRSLSPAQIAAQSYWFANVNTPEDLAKIASYADALED